MSTYLLLFWRIHTFMLFYTISQECSMKAMVSGLITVLVILKHHFKEEHTGFHIDSCMLYEISMEGNNSTFTAYRVWHTATIFTIQESLKDKFLSHGDSKTTAQQILPIILLWTTNRGKTCNWTVHAYVSQWTWTSHTDFVQPYLPGPVRSLSSISLIKTC